MANALALMLLISSSSAAEVDDVQLSPAVPLEVSAVTNQKPSLETRRTTSRDRILQRRKALRGGQQSSTSSLISLIQTNVAPDCWEFDGIGFSAGNGTGNGSGSGRRNAENLAELIQQNAQPLYWEINGGSGSISIFP